MTDFEIEKDIERKLVALVKKYGGRCEKLVNMSTKGFPDRTVLLPGDKIIFVETKRPKGGRYSAMQNKWRDWLHTLGLSYYRIKDVEQLAAFELVLLEETARR